MTSNTHWRDVPAAGWRWPNFSPGDACRGTGKLLVNEAALDALQALRVRLGKPLIIRSAYRSPEHNRAVGGAKASKHMEGSPSTSPWRTTIPRPLRRRPGRSGSKASASTRTRASCISTSGRRGAGASGSRSGRRPSPPRPPPAREALSESRTLKSGGAAGVATVGAAGVEVAQQVLTETQGAVLPLVPYLDTLRWLFITVALGGIAVANYARLDDWKRGRRSWPAFSRGSPQGGLEAPPCERWSCLQPSFCSSSPAATRESGSAGSWSDLRHRRRSVTFSGRCRSGLNIFTAGGGDEAEIKGSLGPLSSK